MITIQILKMKTPVFLNNWKHKFDVIADFENVYMTYDEYNAEKAPYQNEKVWQERKTDLTKAIDLHRNDNILFASYGTPAYEGYAFVLFERDNILYEINGSHCSCYGLEGQWDEEETSIEALEHRLTKGTLGKDEYQENEFHNELCKFLEIDDVK